MESGSLKGVISSFSASTARQPKQGCGIGTDSFASHKSFAALPARGPGHSRAALFSAADIVVDGFGNLAPETATILPLAAADALVVAGIDARLCL